MRSLFSIWFLVFVHYCMLSKRDFSVTLYSETLLGKQSLPSMKIYWKCLHQCMRQICAITIHLDILVAASFCQNGRWWLSKKMSNSSMARKNGQEIEGSVRCSSMYQGDKGKCLPIPTLMLTLSLKFMRRKVWGGRWEKKPPISVWTTNSALSSPAQNSDTEYIIPKLPAYELSHRKFSYLKTRWFEKRSRMNLIKVFF